MALLKKKTPAPVAPAPEPTLADRFGFAQTQVVQAETVALSAADGLVRAAESLAEVSREAYEEASRLLGISSNASDLANRSSEQAGDLRTLLGS